MARRDRLDALSIADVHSSEKHETSNHPSPMNIEAFLPWACGQLQLPFVPLINKKTMISISSQKISTRGKAKEEVFTGTESTSVSNANDYIGLSNINNADLVINIDVVYDNTNSLIQLKFNKNLKVPATLLKIFSLIAHFHRNLTSIYINKGLNQSGLYQLNKIVNAAKVTEVILDNTVLEEANYYILLDENSTLKYLSLARCNLNDSSVKMIASRLNYPSKASKTLSILNLSSNRITDEGAKYLADMLRINRQLTYLNLSGNMISDTGADSILNILIPFPLTADELSQKKARRFIYMKHKEHFIRDTVEQIRLDFEKRYAGRKKGTKPIPFATKKTKSVDAPSDSEKDSPMNGLDSVWLEKAEAAAEEMVGPFVDPINEENTIARNGILYCRGNNIVCYLNLAYNSLTYFSIKKLLLVINVQRESLRSPKGLINVCIEGNNLPDTCGELSQINVLIEAGLNRASNMSTLMKKKPTVRSK